LRPYGSKRQSRARVKERIDIRFVSSDDDDENRNNNIYQFIYLFIFKNKTSMEQKNNFISRAGRRGDSPLARVMIAGVMMFTLAATGA
jgi:hypothetical protein